MIPEDTAEIPEKVYSHNALLKRAALPKAIRVIGRSAFDSCGNLESADLPDGLEEVGDYAFRLCHRLHIPRIPDSVKSIGHSAFLYCYNIEEIRTGNPEIVKGTGATNAKIVKC